MAWKCQFISNLRDLFIHSIIPLANEKLLDDIDLYLCIKTPKECELSLWESIVCALLPDVLEELAQTDITIALKSSFLKSDELHELVRNMMTVDFSLVTFMFICASDMLSNEEFQTRIALEIFKECTADEATNEEVETFEEHYRAAFRQPKKASAQ